MCAYVGVCACMPCVSLCAYHVRVSMSCGCACVHVVCVHVVWVYMCACHVGVRTCMSCVCARAYVSSVCMIACAAVHTYVYSLLENFCKYITQLKLKVCLVSHGV